MHQGVLHHCLYKAITSLLVAKSPNTTKTAIAHTVEAFPALKSDAAYDVQKAMKALNLICSPCFPALPHDGTQRYAIPCWHVERKCQHTERWQTLTHLTTYELHLSAQPNCGHRCPQQLHQPANQSRSVAAFTSTYSCCRLQNPPAVKQV